MKKIQFINLFLILLLILSTCSKEPLSPLSDDVKNVMGMNNSDDQGENQDDGQETDTNGLKITGSVFFCYYIAEGGYSEQSWDIQLTLTFTNKQDQSINGIHLTKVEIYDDSNNKIGERTPDEFSTFWDGSLDARQNLTVIYSCSETNCSDWGQQWGAEEILYTVIYIEANGGISDVVTTSPVQVFYIHAYVALPFPPVLLE